MVQISSTAGSGIPVGQNRLMDWHVAQGQAVSSPGEQASLSYAARDSVTTQLFNITSNASGELYIAVDQSAGGNSTNQDQFGYINGLIVTKL